jgi:transposase
VHATGSESLLLARYGQNNPAIALGRKNHLFAGSDGGGARWATICSLIETCKLNGVEPHTYLTDVLTRMLDGHPINRLDELLPWAWKAENPVKT